MSRPLLEFEMQKNPLFKAELLEHPSLDAYDRLYGESTVPCDRKEILRQLGCAPEIQEATLFFVSLNKAIYGVAIYEKADNFRALHFDFESSQETPDPGLDWDDLVQQDNIGVDLRVEFEGRKMIFSQAILVTVYRVNNQVSKARFTMNGRPAILK